MLQKLHIKNYILIDEVELDWSQGLNIITGETGAGKSILLGALGLILGERADGNALYNKEKKCIIEGIFSIVKKDFKSFFEKNDLDIEDLLYVRRELSPSGGSRAFINDTPVSLQLLRTLTEQLVDVHAQHETTYLNRSEFQMKVVDTYASNTKLLESYLIDFEKYNDLQKQIHEEIQKQNEANKERDYIEFLLHELQEAQLDDIQEQEELESQLKQMENAELISQKINTSIQILDQESGILDQLNTIEAALSTIANYDPKYQTTGDRISSVRAELQDLVSDLQKQNDTVYYDEEKIFLIKERLDLFYKLQKKHKVLSLQNLIDLREEYTSKLQRIMSFDHTLDTLQKAAALHHSQLESTALALHQNRTKVLVPISKKITEQLQDLKMIDARFEIEIKELDKYNSHGKDEIKFMFSANKGLNPQEIKKVASGGELSRLMLCIKNLIADKIDLPTMVFDEIDTGISGETAMRVGTMLEQLSASKQVLTITHLPQIASRQGSHFYVYKSSDKKQTSTHIRKLNDQERIVEIAKMLGGETPSEKALHTASELLQLS